MMKRKYKRKKGPVRSKKVTFDGVTFASDWDDETEY